MLVKLRAYWTCATCTDFKNIHTYMHTRTMSIDERSKRASKRTSECVCRESTKKKIKINMFIWYFSLNTHFLMHCKRPSGVSMAFSKCLFIRPHVRVSSTQREPKWMQWALARFSFFISLFVSLYFCYAVTTDSKLISTRQITELFI